MRFTLDVEMLPASARQLLDQLPEGTGETRFFHASEYLNAYVDRLAFDHLSALGGEPAARAGHVHWLVRKLEGAGLIELDPWGRVARRTPPDEPADAVKARALAEIPELATSFALFDAARDGYVDFLRGKRDGASILLTPLALPIWQSYFDNRDFVYAANNRLAANLCERISLPERPATLLEVGGGFGSAAEMVLARAGARIGRYRFTEPFPFFLASAKRRLAKSSPGAPIEYSALDVNESFAAQGVEPSSVDVLLAVNVLHVARHLSRTLTEIRRSLKSGGALAMVECVRPAPGTPIYLDYPFQLLDEFFRVDDLGPLRPHGGFLTPEVWRQLLQSGGFRLERELPDYEPVARWYRGYFLIGFVARAGA